MHIGMKRVFLGCVGSISAKLSIQKSSYPLMQRVQGSTLFGVTTDASQERSVTMNDQLHIVPKCALKRETQFCQEHAQSTAWIRDHNLTHGQKPQKPSRQSDKSSNVYSISKNDLYEAQRSPPDLMFCTLKCINPELWPWFYLCLV